MQYPCGVRERFGPYELIERLGIGGMAEVFLADVNADVNRDDSRGASARVVVKRMLPQLERDADAVSMFLDEGRLGKRLSGRGIVRTLEVGQADGAHFIALEHVDGADLGAIEGRARNRGQPLPLPMCAWIVARVAEALHEAHSAIDVGTRVPLKVVHRDMSPSNVLVSKTGDVKVADFGVARSALQQSRTATGVLKGKLSYMSPEQLEGESIDARSDIYSLGVVLHELITRRRMYGGLSDVQTLRQILNASPPAPSIENPSVDRELEDIVMRALARAPAARHATAGAMARALDGWLSAHGVGKSTFAQYIIERPQLFRDELAIDPDRTTPARVVSGLKRVKTPSGKGGLKLQRKGDARPRELLLYVEDEPENREVAALRLRRSYDLLLAPDDVTACELLRTRGHELAAVLMDIQLKGSVLDGIQLTRLVRGTLPAAEVPPHARGMPVLARLPIVFVTAYGARYTEAELVAAGGSKLVSKPVNFGELMLALVDLHLSRATRA